MIKLVPYQREYLEPFMGWLNQPSTRRHNPVTPMKTEDIERTLELEGADLSELGRYVSYRWFVDYDGAVVGSVYLKEINHMMMYAEIGYAVDEAYQGRGIATAAVKMMVDKIFSESKLRKLIAYVHDKHEASCRVIEKLGFVREGLLREHYIINGSPENLAIFALLRQDWLQRL